MPPVTGPIDPNHYHFNDHTGPTSKPFVLSTHQLELYTVIALGITLISLLIICCFFGHLAISFFFCYVNCICIRIGTPIVNAGGRSLVSAIGSPAPKTIYQSKQNTKESKTSKSHKDSGGKLPPLMKRSVQAKPPPKITPKAIPVSELSLSPSQKQSPISNNARSASDKPFPSNFLSEKKQQPPPMPPLMDKNVTNIGKSIKSKKSAKEGNIFGKSIKSKNQDNKSIKAVENKGKSVKSGKSGKAGDNKEKEKSAKVVKPDENKGKSVKSNKAGDNKGKSGKSGKVGDNKKISGKSGKAADKIGKSMKSSKSAKTGKSKLTDKSEFDGFSDPANMSGEL
ncbi:hypothetical protein RDWZM_006437 [Blomia tropicalis]|uniref:Uncharacterized protein n=1 Tax=Blomia tropicalis TaxID=40697 RepID=A0A9Q0MBH0_BLOTA|nr:hypothetical protein RDWZM_006437 [Blomia tropicalis]